MKNGKLLIGAMCMGSTCRSPQGYGTLKQKLVERGIPAVVRSFGMIPELLAPVAERPVHLQRAQPHSITIMAERGIDINDHVPEHVTKVNIKDYDLVVVMDPNAYRILTEDVGFPKDKAVLLNAPDGVYNPFDASLTDLLAQDLGRYRKTAAQLDEIMPSVIEEPSAFKFPVV